jgi:hypothetical protein
MWLFFLDYRSLKNKKALKSVETKGNILPATNFYVLEELNVLPQFLCTSQHTVAFLVIEFCITVQGCSDTPVILLAKIKFGLPYNEDSIPSRIGIVIHSVPIDH